jgi:hypothetical protein
MKTEPRIPGQIVTAARSSSSVHHGEFAHRAVVLAGICALLGTYGMGGCAAAGDANASGDTLSGAGGSGNGSAQGTTGTQGNGGAGFDGGIQSDGSGGGCTAVDILFVIDNSSSMCSYQDSLAQAFPFFADAIYSALPAGTDLHVGITTSAFCTGGSHGESNCVAGESASFIDTVFQTPSEGMVAGNGYQGRLLDHNGQQFYAANTGDMATKTGLSQWFAGAATSVGCGGCAFDFTVGGAAYAADPINAATNAGFFRDEDTVLLLFFLTDEADHSPEGLQLYHDKLTAVKSKCGGDACIIAGGLLSLWCNGPTATTNIWQFVNMFGEPPVWGDIRGGTPFGGNVDPMEYTKIIAGALTQVVAQTCEEIGVPK